nr:hypothetical protein Iba_chr09fCG12280 [Ipomoea batatas]
MQPYEEENMEDMNNKILARIEELEQEMANIREGWKQEFRQRTSSLGQETQASIRTLEDQMAQVAKCGNEGVCQCPAYMTSENNCIIEDVDNACVEMPSDEIGVKEHDNFCDEPYDDYFDHNCGDAYIENVVGNVDCVVDNVHPILWKNVDGLESFTFGDESLSNEHVDDLHEMLCSDDEMNVLC